MSWEDDDFSMSLEYTDKLYRYLHDRPRIALGSYDRQIALQDEWLFQESGEHVPPRYPIPARHSQYNSRSSHFSGGPYPQSTAYLHAGAGIDFQLSRIDGATQFGMVLSGIFVATITPSSG